MTTRCTTPHLHAVIPEPRFIVDRGQQLVRDTLDPSFNAELLQTQSSLLRDDDGNIIGVEVLYLCVTRDGRKFVLDESA